MEHKITLLFPSLSFHLSVCFEKRVTLVHSSRCKTSAVCRPILSFCTVPLMPASLSAALSTMATCCSSSDRRNGIPVATFPSFTMAVDTADTKRREYALCCYLGWGSTFSEQWSVCEMQVMRSEVTCFGGKERALLNRLMHDSIQASAWYCL